MEAGGTEELKREKGENGEARPRERERESERE